MREPAVLGYHYVTRQNLAGTTYRVWEREMPHIPNDFAECSIFMYPSERAARNGINAGGSGFLIHVPSLTAPGWGHTYAVTNKHLIDGNDCAIRLNKKAGGIDVIPTTKDDWFSHPDEDDVEVYPIDLGSGFRYRSIGTDTFLDRETIEAFAIGYGDDVFLVGRLTTQSGHQRNTPVVRFGNISLMADPSEPIKYNAHEQEAFLVECRSISGFSGSPVFLMSHRFYREADAKRVSDFLNKKSGFDPDPSKGMVVNVVAMERTVGPLLLGIDFGHIPYFGPVYYQKTGQENRRPTTYETETGTGIAGVVPAWKILEILDHPTLVSQRKKGDSELATKQQDSEFVLDSAASGGDIDPLLPEFTEQDFDADLRRVTRRVGTSEPDLGTK